MSSAGGAGENFGEAPELDLGASEAHLALPDAAEVTAIQLELGCDVAAAVTEWRRRAGRGGRKPGAKNKRNQDLARYLAQFGPDPAVTLMRLQARPVEMLAAELGCTKEGAAHLIVRAASELMPYLHSKKPVDVNVSARGHMTLILESGEPAAIDGGQLGAIEDAAPLLSFAGAETAQFQPLSGQDRSASE